MNAESMTNPALGVFIFMLGGLAGAVFYMPFKKVKNWAWESYWLVYAVFGLVVVPWVLAFITSPNVITVLKNTPGKELAYCCLCGAMWGLGGLTWGLMIRYLGVGLGLALGCGLCSAAGTLVPPILKPILDRFLSSAPTDIPLSEAIANGLQGLHGTPSANAAMIGVLISLVGIVMVGMAGMSKERELSEEEKKKTVAEFDFKKGILVAIFSGLMSAGMNFGLQGGTTMTKLAGSVAPATSPAWTGMPVLVVVLLGGFVINFLWCLFLNVKNKTTGDYTKSGIPLVANFVFAALAGTIWCSQFICLKTGEPAMGKTAYVGFAVLMASAILFSSLLGIALGEWRGTGSRTRTLLASGLVLLLASAVVAGYSGYLGQQQTITAMAIMGMK